MNNGYAEYCVKKKPDARQKALRILHSLFFTAVPLVLAALLIATKIPAVFVAGILILALIFIPAALFTLRFFNIEYEYTIVGDEMSIDVIYGAKSRKNVRDIDLKNVTAFAPYSEAFARIIDDREYDKVYNIAASGGKDDGSFFITFEEGGKNCAVIFDANEKALAMLKQSCRSAMLTRDM